MNFLSISRKKQKSEEPDSKPRPRQIVETRIKPNSLLSVGKRISFGLDDFSLQMAAARHLGPSVTILDARKVYLPKTADTPEKQASFVASTIAQYVKEFGGWAPEIVLTLMGKETAFRTFLMPALKRKELDSAVRLEVRNQVPFPMDNCVFDYRTTSKVTIDDIERNKLALYAATQEKIFGQLHPFQESSTGVTSITHAQDVLGQLLTRLPNFDPKANHTLLCINKGFSEISFFEGSTIRFFHSGNLGGTIIGHELDSTQIEFFAESLISEIRTSIDYYVGQFGGSFDSRILVHGDLANSKELLEALEKGTQYKYSPFPTEKLALSGSEDISKCYDYSVCLPVVASAVCQTKTINLLPDELREKASELKIKKFGSFAVAIITILIAISWYSLELRNDQETKELKQLKEQISTFENSEAYHTYNNMKLRIASNNAYIKNAKPTASVLGFSLKELSLITPSGVKLIHLQYNQEPTGRNLMVQGIVSSKSIPPEIILAEYVENLSSSPLYENVALVRHTKKITEEGFEIEFSLEMRGIV